MGNERESLLDAIGEAQAGHVHSVLAMMHRPPEPAGASIAAAPVDNTKPCDGCRNLARCRADKLACAAASLFCHGGDSKRWAIAPRVPTRAQWQALFVD